MSASSSSGSRRRSPCAIWASSVSIGTSELARKAVAIILTAYTGQGVKKTQGQRLAMSSWPLVFTSWWEGLVCSGGRPGGSIHSDGFQQRHQQLGVEAQPA